MSDKTGGYGREGWSKYLMDDALVQRDGDNLAGYAASVSAAKAIVGVTSGLHRWRNIVTDKEAADLLGWLRENVWDFLEDPEMDDWCRGAMWLADELEGLRRAK